MNRNVRRLQAGFTLVEALVVLAIISLIAVISMTAFDGSKSKAQTMLAVMGQAAQASQQFRTDTGVYPANLSGLIDKADAADINGKALAANVQNLWSRPYMAMQKMSTVNPKNFVIDKVGSGVELNIKVLAGGLGKIYYIEATNVPADIVTNAIRECNTSDGSDIAVNAANLAANKCVGVAGSNQFALVFDQTR